MYTSICLISVRYLILTAQEKMKLGPVFACTSPPAQRSVPTAAPQPIELHTPALEPLGTRLLDCPDDVLVHVLVSN